jgi:hypothetical protein
LLFNWPNSYQLIRVIAMKAQYVGDIGDFGKVLLLKHLAVCGFKIGVNWVLTPNDNRTDGKHRDYTTYKGKDCLCCCDQEVYEAILPLANKQREKRAIADLEALTRRFAPRSFFFDDVFEARVDRGELDQKARDNLSTEQCDLVFFDPDNGIDIEAGKSEKHVYLPEMKRYWDRGQSLLIYHHLGRAGTHEQQMNDLRLLLEQQMCSSTVFNYRLCRGTARAYFLVVRPEHRNRLADRESVGSIAALQATKKQWGRPTKTCTRAHPV